jgi:hypothetical protein
MRLEIDVMERECKNLEFGREVNKALVSLLQTSPLSISKKIISPIRLLQNVEYYYIERIASILTFY